MQNSFKTEYVTCYLFSHILFCCCSDSEMCITYSEANKVFGQRYNTFVRSSFFPFPHTVYTPLIPNPQPVYTPLIPNPQQCAACTLKSHSQISFFTYSRLFFHQSYQFLWVISQPAFLPIVENNCTLEAVSGFPINVFQIGPCLELYPSLRLICQRHRYNSKEKKVKKLLF